ncbi:MAG: MBL fold metallo-hydrolase [Candidatus Fonsibacter sp.]
MLKYFTRREFIKTFKEKISFLFLFLLTSCAVTQTERKPTDRQRQDSVLTFPETKDENFQRPYHHLPDGTFRNPEGSIERTDIDFPWMTFWRERMAVKFEIPKNHVVPKDEVLKNLQALENSNTITWIGHCTFLIKIDGKTIITDPFFSKNAGPLALGPRRFIDPAIPLDKLPKTDFLLLTHNHYDHLDDAATKNYPHKKTKVITSLNNGSFYKNYRFRDVQEMDWYQTSEFENLKITFLPAIHWSKRELFDRNRTLWGSFLIENNRKKILFCCDTAVGDIYKKLGREYGPFDIVFINIGAYEPQHIMKYGHCSPEEAIEVARQLRARKIIGMHWGTIVLSLEDPFDVPNRFLQNANNFGYKESDLVLFKIGETKLLEDILKS